MERYNSVSNYYKQIFGERTLKICVDGNFTCPNRDGSKGTGGCIFCSERGSGEQLKRIPIAEQVKNYLNSYKSKRANKFVVYFQNFTNTYAPLKVLEERYLSCLVDDRIVAINIGTRPDCITEDVAKLLYEIQASKRISVYVELGLQTANEKTGVTINRCYSNSDFINAVSILNKYGIKIITHLMIGLPQERVEDIYETVSFLNKFNIHGLKIHSTYIVENTALHRLHLNGKYEPISKDFYVEMCAYIINHINPNIIIYRITADAPREKLVAPSWNAHKKIVLNSINKYFNEHDVIQGKFFK